MPVNALAMDRMDEINVLTDRVQKRKRECMEAALWVSSLRSHSYTESWKETEAAPFHLRRAKAFARVLEDLPVFIRDSELIVGSATKFIRGAEVMVEFNPYDILDSMREGRIEGLSKVVTAKIEDEEAKLLEEDARFWVGKSTRDVINEAWQRELGEAYLDLADHGVRVYDHNVDVSPKGSSSFNPRVLREGLNGTIARARSEKEKMYHTTCQMPDVSPAGYHKRVVLDSIIVTCEAMIKYASKHADLARNLAKIEKDLVRKRELERIAERCERVPANPARNFAEALQSIWFIHLGLLKEQPLPAGMCAGRMDQYLYPFYERDLKEGRLTHQEAAELLGCLWVKMNELEAFRGSRVNESRAGSLLQQVTIGGQTKEGRDATNELSYLILEVSRQLKMPQPGIYIRYHHSISHEFMVKAVETNRDTGGGIPAFLSDQSAVNRLVALGVKLDDAIEWNASGCLLFTIGHVQAAHPRAVGMINMPKVFEIALNNGVDPRTGKQVGLQTGDVTRLTRIEELYEAFEKQFDYFVDKLLRGSFIGHSARMERYSLPLTTVLLEDCITKGLDAYEGGERYPQMSVIWGMKGHVEIADCFAAIKKLVFEQKKITMSELLEALKANFEGKEALRRLCLQAPKYGNDDDYVDDIYNYVTLKTQEIMLGKHNPWTGKPLAITRPAVSVHYYYGAVVGALPNGRKAWLPLYDAGLSPMGGADVNGPTAVINSATKINHCPPEQNGLVLNMKSSCQMLQTRKAIENFLALLKTFFDRGGWHIQFNIINREDLLEAQKHPEQWRHLIVRVAGYSAYFVDLPSDLQDEIIGRTLHEM